MNIHTEFPVCNSGQYIYVMTLCNFFFVSQDSIDIINSYFHSIASRGTCFWLVFNTLRHKFFPMKISSSLWNAAAYTCKEKLWCRSQGSIKCSNFHSFKEGVIILCQRIEMNITFTWISSLYNPLKIFFKFRTKIVMTLTKFLLNIMTLRKCIPLKFLTNINHYPYFI